MLVLGVKVVFAMFAVVVGGGGEAVVGVAFCFPGGLKDSRLVMLPSLLVLLLPRCCQPRRFVALCFATIAFAFDYIVPGRALSSFTRKHIIPSFLVVCPRNVGAVKYMLRMHVYYLGPNPIRTRYLSVSLKTLPRTFLL